MSTEVKRFVFKDWEDDIYAKRCEVHDGDYVLASDYDSLLAQRDEAIRLLTKVEELYSSYGLIAGGPGHGTGKWIGDVRALLSKLERS